MNKIENYIVPPGRSLGLKVVSPGGMPESPKASEDFKGWNLTPGGGTEAPDWNPEPRVGGGLHVWEWAQGDLDASGIWFQPNVVWMAVEFDSSEAVRHDGCNIQSYIGVLRGKVKVPKCRTIAVSLDRKEIVSFIKQHTPEEESQGLFFFEEQIVEEGDVTVGDGGVAESRGTRARVTAGSFGTAIAGASGRATAGKGGTARAGDGGCARVGWCGTAFSGIGGCSISGASGTAISGDEGYSRVDGCGGNAKTGDRGVAVTGDEGFAEAGDGGHAQVGNGGRAKAGREGTARIRTGSLAMTGDGGWISFEYEGRLISYSVARNEIKPHTFYRLEPTGTLVQV